MGHATPLSLNLGIFGIVVCSSGQADRQDLPPTHQFVSPTSFCALGHYSSQTDSLWNKFWKTVVGGDNWQV